MRKTIHIMLLGILGLLAASCDDNKSYAELLTEENEYINAFLADQRVVGYVPADSVFETGTDAPYYRMDDEGNVYMQVLDAGDMSNRPVKDDKVYFRFMRYNLSRYTTDGTWTGGGNANDISGGNGVGSTYFLFDDLTSSQSSTYGEGLQVPMYYLGADAKVNLVIKSQKGWANEIANVVPYLYQVRYYCSPMSPWGE